MRQKNRLNNIWKHILGITCFIFYEQLYQFLSSGKHYFAVAALYYIMELAIFYIASYYLMPLWERSTKGVVKSTLLILLAIGIFCVVQYGLGILVMWQIEGKPDLKFKGGHALKILGRCLYVLGFAFVFYLFRLSLQKERYLRKLEGEHYQLLNGFAVLENNYHRSRHDTHLMFNSINLVYGHVGSVSEEAAEPIELTTNILQYGLGQSDEKGMVPLKEELEQVDNYIKLIRLIKKNTCYLNVWIDISRASSIVKIPPVIIISMIENMVKHGNLYERKVPASLKIICIGNELSIEVFNLKMKGIKPLGFGIGFSSVKERLERQYPGAHSFDINEDHKQFRLKCWIKL